MSDGFSRRLSRVIAGLALLAAGYYWAFGGGYTPGTLDRLENRVETRGVEVATLQTRLDSIRAWGDSLDTDPWVIERIARERYGFIRSGELLVRFVETR